MRAPSEEGVEELTLEMAKMVAGMRERAYAISEELPLMFRGNPTIVPYFSTAKRLSVPETPS